MKKVIFLGTPIVILAVVILLTQINSSYPLDFANDEKFLTEAYNDYNQQGDSEIKEFTVLDDKITFRYHLTDTINFPYSGFSIRPKDKGCMDISPYSRLKLRFKATAPRIQVHLTYYIEGFTDEEENVETRLFTEVWVNTSPEIKEMIIPLDRFKIPKWWYENNNLSLNYDEAIDKRYFMTFDMVGCETTNIGHDHKIVLEEVELLVDFFPLYLICGIGAALYYCFISAYFLSKMKQNKGRKRKNIIILPPSPEQDEANPGSTRLCNPGEFDRLMEYINTHYGNPELSLDFIYRETGLSPKKINRLLNKNLQTSFIKYLNNLRVEKGKKLLRETDLPVTEIAYQLGYNNPSHFNRTFKSLEEMPPQKYRTTTSPH